MSRQRAFLRDEQGHVTAFVVITAITCLLFAGLVLDGGLALSAKVRAISHAEEAARAGAQELDLAIYRERGVVRLEPAAARSAASRYLTAVGARGTVRIVDNTVTVTVTAQQPTHLLSLVGFAGVTVSGTGHARPEQGALGGS